MERILWHFY